MSTASPNRLTPWTARLLVVHAGMLVILMAVLTAPAFREALQFDPAAPLERPWTWLTHLVIHAGPLHLAISSLVLFVFGPAVEALLGGRRFLQLYLGCGLGTALFGVLLAGILDLPPVVGPGGAILGVALASALLSPEAEIQVFPLPVPLSAGTVLGILVVLDLLGGLRFADDGLAHLAHAGGLLTAYAWYRTRGLGRRQAASFTRASRHPVMASKLLAHQEEHAPMVPPPPPARPEPTAPREPEHSELDRLLDKISAGGLESLTAEEQQQLKAIAERKREDGEQR